MKDDPAISIPWHEFRDRRLLGTPPRALRQAQGERALRLRGAARRYAQGERDDGEDAERRARVRRAMLSMQRASWEQGLAAQAALEEGEAELAILLAREAVLRQGPDGRLAQLGADPGVTDPGAAGEAVVFAALATGERWLAEGAERMLGWLLRGAPRSADGVLFHQLPAPDGELWSDSFYMAPPFLALAGQPEEALRQLRGLRRRLWLASRHLFAHRWNETRGGFIREAAWGVGNGWAAAGMARTLEHLPPSMGEERQELAGWIGEVMVGCLRHQRPDGLFHDVVDDPATFTETNLAQMLAWTIYRGIAGGWLDPGLQARAEVMRNAVVAKVDAAGLVQGVCGSPAFDGPGTAAEGQAFFLMMEAARAAVL